MTHIKHTVGFLFSVFFLSLLTALNAHSQVQVAVSGSVTDNTGKPLIGASVALLRPQDSTVVAGAKAEKDGDFAIAGVSPGAYLLRVTYIGYHTLYQFKKVTDRPLALGRLVLQESSVKLDEVTVTAKLPPAELKGDTTEYNSGAFKTNPDATAGDLVNKMPGVTTTQDGKVQAQGENVNKVLVDGKPFFGDDPNAVLKNIPAEVVQKIQVFDEKSSQSQFTGFDDGNTTKTMNLITKPQFRNGTFGKLFAGYGYQDKWKGGLTLNFFNDQQRITVLGVTNNINEQNFSIEDLLGVMSGSGGGMRPPGGFGRGGPGGRGGGGRGGMRGGGGDGGAIDNFLVDQKNGLTTTDAFGVNYSDKWGAVNVTGSYFLNWSDNKSLSDLFRQYTASANQGLAYSENSNTGSKNLNNRLNLKIEWQLDTLNSILFQPRFSTQNNVATSALTGSNRLADTLLSRTDNIHDPNLKGISASAPLLFRHAFETRGRTLSLNITPGYNTNDGTSALLTSTQYFTGVIGADTTNQSATLDKKGTTLAYNVTYTEPLSQSGQLMATYNGNLNNSQSDKRTYAFSKTSGEYTLFDSLLSNTFTSRYLAQAAGLSYRVQDGEVWNMTAGVSYQWSKLTNDQAFPVPFKVNRTFTSLLPNAMLTYRPSMKENLRINLRSSNNAPSVDQLQDVINNTNPLLLSIGNPALNQDMQYNLNLRYSNISTENSTSFFAFVSGSITKDYIGNNTITATADTVLPGGIPLQAGQQLTRPVNADGYYNLRSFANYSFPFRPVKLNINLNGGASYTRTPGLVNDALNYAGSLSLSGGVVIGSNISPDVDFTLWSFSSYNATSNTIQTAGNNNYFNQYTRLRFQVMPWEGLVLESDISHQFNNGLSGSLDKGYILWNAGLGYKFLTGKAAELRLSVFDILNQNKSLTRNTTDAYYEDVQTTALQRYAMLTFTYNLRAFGEMKPENRQNDFPR